jgi:phosphatidylserine/phosphatidylglycerophosphate/cardiolipin synthase-like enzyme
VNGYLGRAYGSSWRGTSSTHLLIGVLLSALISGSVLAFDPLKAPMAAEGTLQPAFAPQDDIESLLIEVINNAKEEVLVQAYLLTNKKIATALIASHERGVDVRILADASQSRIDSSKVDMLVAAGIPVWLETKYLNAHNKVIVVDAHSTDATVVTGSFNFTWGAQHKNAENVLIARRNPRLASRYANNWDLHRLEAVRYERNSFPR